MPVYAKIVGHARRILTNVRRGTLKITMESIENWVNVRCGRISYKETILYIRVYQFVK